MANGRVRAEAVLRGRAFALVACGSPRRVREHVNAAVQLTKRVIVVVGALVVCCTAAVAVVVLHRQVSVPKKDFSLHQDATNPRELATPLDHVPGIGRAFGLRERVVPSSSPLAYPGPLDLSRSGSVFGRSPADIHHQREAGGGFGSVDSFGAVADDEGSTVTMGTAGTGGGDSILSSVERAEALRKAGPDLSFAGAGVHVAAKPSRSTGAAHASSPAGSAHNYVKQRQKVGGRGSRWL